MAFSPTCIKSDKKPKLYLVQSFLTLPNVGKNGKWTDLPAEVRKAFDDTLQRSRNLLTIKSADQGQSAAGTPLFTLTSVNSLSDVPSILNAGDIVIGYDYTPPYALNADYRMQNPPVSDEKKLVDTTFEQFHTGFLKKLQEKAKVAVKPATGLKEKPEEVGDEGGASAQLFQRMNALNGKQPTYFSFALGVVNIGPPITKALYVLKTKDAKKKVVEVLQKSDLSPASLKGAASAAGQNGPAFLEAVGRGLAYTTLHEFWHCASAQDHTLGTGSIIEGAADASDLKQGKPLTLTNDAITIILQRYSDIWCDCINKNMKNISEL